MYSFAVIEVLSIAIFTLLYVYNVKWRRSQIRVFATLSHKYQTRKTRSADYINIMPLYYVLLPLLTLWIDRCKSKKKSKGIKKDAVADDVGHFRMLQKMFDIVERNDQQRR
ncbi:hypothetical protein Tcan_11271 [Toxocara canis]|uniref:Uncharacterized protein n=1 Tax=Toxocara canis TaxID=6265 RepID=A0A0B2UZF5_TOXCA|nr:hypothetical protein Tcan_11271 [Toxocara canis]